MKAGHMARRFAGAATKNNLAGVFIILMALTIPSPPKWVVDRPNCNRSWLP
jgi:hypothetical protein